MLFYCFPIVISLSFCHYHSLPPCCNIHTLAYYEIAKITATKSFIVQIPYEGEWCINSNKEIEDYAVLKLEVWMQCSIPYHCLLENVTVIEFLCRIDIFSIQFLFTKSIQITELKNSFNYPNQTAVSIQHFLDIKSNNWKMQIIKFLNIKLSFFKSWIGIETKSALFIFCQN